MAKRDQQQPQVCTDVAEIAILGAESLIALGKLNLDDWLERQLKKSPHLDTPDSVSPQAILAAIPVALFFHENKIKLRQNLLHLLKIWQDDPIVRDVTLALGYAIAQSLVEQLEPRTLIPQTIAFIGETETSVPQQLLKVNNLLKQGAGLEKVQAELNREIEWSHAIGMTFYCFLSTSEDFRLTVLRAISNNDIQKQDSWSLRSQTIAAMTGALSGAYNSIMGIPVKWQVRLSPEREITSFSQMLELADALVGMWSGVYALDLSANKTQEDESIMSDAQATLCIYAAPRVIRSR
ncbi:ADP-ribosylglycohydrolase family protein [Halotia branconii]|uniref:ADP-ribosylglycohydrolase family protein n=1 Tax=Halotia branconii TaxID=1620816 RepID=UPI0031B87FA4